MVLEGVVTNVTAFGAFVDIGVHQDGLVHVSQLADRFVKDPERGREGRGQKINVRVLEVDLERKRIALSARKDDAPRPQTGSQASPSPGSGAARGPGASNRKAPARSNAPPQKQETFANNPFAKLLRK